MDDAGAIRRLRVTGAIAILTIALLTCASAAFLAWRYSTAPIRSDMVNRSGLRRGQSVAVLYRAERLARFPAATADLQKAIQTLEDSQNGLNDLSPADTASYRQFIAAARAVAANPRSDRLRDALEALGPSMYAIFYDRTIGYAASSNTQRERSFRTTMTVSAVTLIVLGLLYVFVIVPSERVVAATVRELEERRQRFAAMFDNSSEMMAIYDAQGAIVRGNRSAAKVLGFGDDTVGSHFSLHIASRDRDLVENAFSQAAAGRASELGVTFVSAGGEEIPVLASLTPIIVDGNVVGVVGAARDMTSERQFELELLRGRERFRTLFESSPSAIAAFTPAGIITEVNVAMERLSGYRNEELVGKHASMLVPTDYGDDANARVARLLEGEARTFHLELRARGGATVSLEADLLPIVIDGSREGVFLIGKDLTREEALARLDQRDERMRALYRIASSPEAEAASQIDDALALGAQALGTEYGYVSRYLEGVSTVEHRVGPEGVLPLHSTFATIPSIGANIVSSPRATTVNDMTVEPYASQMRERGLPWKSYIGGRVMVGGEPYGLLVFCGDRVRRPPFEQADRDFIDLMCALIGSAIGRQALQDELSKMAFHDSLTGLANRALLEEHLARAIHLAQRSKELVAVHYLDLNRFKPVNDAYGHAAGDRVLREIARRFTAAVRAQDIVARIGGDEFVVLQTGVKDEEAVHLLAARLHASVNECFAIGSGGLVEVGVSVGTAIFPRDAIDAPGLLRFADAAMYREKELRRTAV